MTQNKLVEALERIADWLDDPRLNTYPYMEGTGFYEDKAAHLKRAREALSTAQAQEPVDESVVISREVLDFLLGAGPLDGCHFGDKHPTERGAFWWRKHILASPPAPSTPDARAIVEACAKVAEDFEGTASMERADDPLSAAGCAIADAIRAKASEIIAALPLPTPSAPDAALREEAFPLLIDLETALILTANYNETMSVSDFVRLSAEFGRVQKWFHENQHALSNSGQMEKGA